MPSLPSRKALEDMKRPEIQKLCKGYNIKANLKTDELIELLLSAPTSSVRKSPPPTRRSVSTRHSSMIVHEPDELDEEDEEETENQPEPEPEPHCIPTRSRKKAKETQTRLGVGRPAVAGGSGPRAVTKSVSVTRAKRGRSSRAVKPTEETIPEEVEEDIAPELPLPGPSNQADFNRLVSTTVEDALQPLTQQLQSMQSELIQLRKQVADMQALEQRLATLTASSSAQAATIAALEADVKLLKEDNVVAMNPRLVVANPSTPRLYSPVTRPISVANLRAPAPIKNDDLPNPGIAPTLLGKRSRDSTSSNLTGIIEDGDQDGLTEEELANAVLRPTKKRMKMDEEEDDELSQAGVQSGSAFTVYSGEEEPYVDPPPPTQHLPEFYGPSSSPNTSGSGRQTSTQNESENRHPFTFAFLPISSTPADAAFNMPNFPYPEAPTSPSPAGSSSINPSLLRNQGERTDIFQSFGLPAPTRPRSRITSASVSRSMSNHAASRPGPETASQPQRPSNPEDAPSFGFGDALPDLDPQSALTRTMYGTELDVDARFGDFGLQGVASGFWAGSRF
ncbi:hypothetical protein C8F01DRAFT_1226149 [Mycena amicta]|nr:hypothetical protein C8F01DRAFT_1226149 [Mycena amicta]